MAFPERKQEIIDKCLATFVRKGLTHTSTKDLCDALHLNSGGVFYYFENKDAIVIACAEEANKRIERDLFGVAIHDIENPDKLAKDLYERANTVRPLMKFFVSVCVSSKYADAMSPSLDNLNKRYKHYVEQFAKKLGAKPEDVSPYVYIVINTMMSYMLFGKTCFVAPQLDLVYGKLVGLLNGEEREQGQNQQIPISWKEQL